MIGAVNEQFGRFVAFAQERVQAGKEKAIASKGDVMAGGGTTLEERKIKVTDKIDWVSLSIFRGSGAQRANNEVRDLFRKSIADMFGGENNIPDSVKEAMLLKDYGCGKPLTARRILAVKTAIENLERGNAFDKTNDPDGALANKAFDAGYTRLDFGRLNTAANLLVKAANVSLHDAMEEVLTRGSAANRTMNAGSLYMKDVESFRKGYDSLKHVAQSDVRDLEVASQCGSEASQRGLSEVAENLAYKFRNVLNETEMFLAAANLPEETIAELRTVAEGLADEMGQIANDIRDGDLKGRKEIYKKLFDNKNVYKMSDIVEKKIAMPLGEAAKSNPAIAEFKNYIKAHFTDVKTAYDKLAATYRSAVAHDMAEILKAKLIGAAHEYGIANNKETSVPKPVLDNIEEFLQTGTFDRIENIEKFCAKLEKYGDAALRFNAEQKAEMKKLVDQTFGPGPKADKLLQRFIDQFELSFFADQVNTVSDYGNEPTTAPEIVLGHFKANPEALRYLETGFKLDTDEDVAAAKTAIKGNFTASLNKFLADTNPKNLTSLVSGIMPQSVREYNVGFVTFNGQNIPRAQLGTDFPQLIKDGDKDDSVRNGYAEFLEKTFDAEHKKMRQIVSFACGMAEGFGGEIDSLIDHGGENVNLKSIPRDKLLENGSVIAPAGRHRDDNYNIEIADNGDVKITFTHFIQNKVTTLIGESGMYAPRGISSSIQGPILGEVKVVASMTIKNASDAELGDAMPQFTIDDIRQEEV